MKRFLQGAVVSLVLGAAMIGLQQEEIPPANDPSHPGQPEWCTRDDGKRYKANCMDCKASCKQPPEGAGGEDTRCKTYCRKGACSCHPECGS